MIRLNVFIRTTESNREELVRTAKELAAASLKDEGCVAYDLFESATRSDVLMICAHCGGWGRAAFDFSKNLPERRYSFCENRCFSDRKG